MGDRISVREPARADSPVMSVSGSCVQPLEQYEIAGHIFDVRTVAYSIERDRRSWYNF